MKITNDMLAQYLRNKALIKEMEQANEVIAIGIKANGGANTSEYTAVVEQCQRQSVAGKKVFDEVMGPGWLEKHDLLNVSTYEKITVVAKRSKVS